MGPCLGEYLHLPVASDFVYLEWTPLGPEDCILHRKRLDAEKFPASWSERMFVRGETRRRKAGVSRRRIGKTSELRPAKRHAVGDSLGSKQDLVRDSV